MSSIPAWQQELLHCPTCSSRLEPSPEAFRCPACGEAGKLRDGVPYFVEGAPYWGEVPQADMHKLMALCEQQGWRQGLETFYDDDPSGQRARFVEKLNDPSVGNWSALIDLDHDATVMDIGAGMGTMTRTLARRFERVIALEQVPERIQFIRLRSAQEGMADRVGVVCANAYQPPFADRSFDLISMNGVLEWLPLADAAPDPRESQMKILRSVHRMLKPGGMFYIGIEGRYALRQLLGEGGPHYERGFTAALPRPLARWNHRRTNNEEYRTYVHSPQVLGRMMTDAGFDPVEIVDVSPSYNFQRYITPFSGKGMLKFRKEQLRDLPLGSPKWEAANNFLQAAGLGKRTSVQYLVFGTRGKA